MAEVACGTCGDTYSVEVGADGVGRMTYDPCPDCTEPLLIHGDDTTGDEMMIDTPMGEHLTVEGRGSTRQDALDDADRQAVQYFGEDASLARTIGQATPSLRRVDGEVTLWTVDVDYRRSR